MNSIPMKAKAMKMKIAKLNSTSARIWRVLYWNRYAHRWLCYSYGSGARLHRLDVVSAFIREEMRTPFFIEWIDGEMLI